MTEFYVAVAVALAAIDAMIGFAVVVSLTGHSAEPASGQRARDFRLLIGDGAARLTPKRLPVPELGSWLARARETAFLALARTLVGPRAAVPPAALRHAAGPISGGIHHAGQ